MQQNHGEYIGTYHDIGTDGIYIFFIGQPSIVLVVDMINSFLINMNFKVLVFILCRFTSICLLHKYMSFFLKGQALKTEVSHKKDCSSLIPYIL